jgi:hypothetical protein
MSQGGRHVPDEPDVVDGARDGRSIPNLSNRMSDWKKALTK